MPDETKETQGSAKVDTQPTPGTQPAPAPTPEEIEAAAKSNIDALFGDFSPGEKKEKKTDVEKTEPAPVAAPDKKAEPGKDAAPKKEKAQTVMSGLTDEPANPDPAPSPAPAPAKPASAKPGRMSESEIVEVSERVAELVKPAKEEKPAAAVDPFADFGGSEREQLDALQFMSENDPRFKGRKLAEETIGFWKKETDYIAKWEAKHPGETFQADDAEHADFYRKHEPKGVSDEDLVNAQVEMKVAKRVTELRKELKKESTEAIEKRLAPIEHERALKIAEPKIRQGVIAAREEFVRAVLPDVVGEDGLTREKIDKLREEDPDTFTLVDEESAVLNVRIVELEKMTHLGERFEFDPAKIVRVNGDNITPHNDIVEAHYDLEERIVALPEDKQVHEGKRFITRKERRDIIDRIAAAKVSTEEKSRRMRALEDETWSVSVDDIRAVFVEKSAKKVQKILGIVKKSSGNKSGNSSNSEQKATADNAGQTQSRQSVAPPSAASSSSDFVNTRVPGAGATRSQAEINSSAFFE